MRIVSNEECVLGRPLEESRLVVVVGLQVTSERIIARGEPLSIRIALVDLSRSLRWVNSLLLCLSLLLCFLASIFILISVVKVVATALLFRTSLSDPLHDHAQLRRVVRVAPEYVHNVVVRTALLASDVVVSDT